MTACFRSVVRFRRTGESTRSEDDAENREQVVKMPEQTDLESVALADGAPVPREFANPTDGGYPSRLRTHTPALTLKVKMNRHNGCS